MKKVACAAFFFFLLFHPFAFPITLVRVGYIDLDRIIQIYTVKYLEAEIKRRESFVNKLQTDYSSNYQKLSDRLRNDLQTKIRSHKDVIAMLNSNKYYWENSREIKDEVILQIVQRDIMESIKKASEIEGYSLVLDNTGNFVYGSDDINLTDKVIFRLDEKLLDLQEKEPLVPLSLELEETPNLLIDENRSFD